MVTWIRHGQWSTMPLWTSRYIPSKHVTCSQPLPPWITSSVRAIRKRNRVRHLTKRSNSPSARATFRRLRNLAISAIRKAKRSFSPRWPSLVVWASSGKCTITYPTTPPKSPKPCQMSTTQSPHLEKATILNNNFATCFAPPTLPNQGPPQIIPTEPTDFSLPLLCSLLCEASDWEQ